MLTEVVDYIGLGPLRSVRPRLCSSLIHSRIQEEVVNLVLAELVQGLPRESSDALEIREVERQQRHAVLPIVLELVIRSLCRLGVSGAKDEFVGLRLLEELLDSLEALRSTLAE